MGIADASADVVSAAGDVLQQWFASTGDGEDGYVVGWGTLALINAGLAQGKFRRGWVWFLLSIPLGPIATLLVVVLEARDPGRPLPTPMESSSGPASTPAAAGTADTSP